MNFLIYVKLIRLLKHYYIKTFQNTILLLKKMDGKEENMEKKLKLMKIKNISKIIMIIINLFIKQVL